MSLKIIARLGAREASSTDATFKELFLSIGTATLEISDKIEAAGRVWTTKISAKLTRDSTILREPCIFRIRTTDAIYIIGTPDLPVNPTIKEDHLVSLSIEFKSKTKPTELKRVLLINPDYE